MSTKAAQKWAARPGSETCNLITVRIYDCGAVDIGIVFTVSAEGSDFDRYAAYLLPTKEDGYILQADFAQIAEESGFVESK